jgi:hypothetical protein
MPLRRSLAFVFLACIAWAAAAEVDARRVEDLMRKSGIWEQAAAVRDQIKAGAREAWSQGKSAGRQGPGPSDMARFEAAADKAFAADAMRRTIAADMRRTLSPADVDEVLVWLSSDAGRRITRLEEEHSHGKDAPKDLEDARAIVSKLSRKRVDILERLAAAIDAGEHSFQIMLNMTSAIVYAMAAVSPQADPAEAAGQVRKALEAQHPEMKAYYHELAIASMAQTYRKVNDAELERYAAFNEAPAARRYNEAGTKGFDRALVQGCLELGRELGREAQVPQRVS